MTYILHLETSTKVCSVAVSCDGRLLDYQTENAHDFVHSERLNGLIQDLLIGNDLNISSLDAVSISSGPGSYTGLRIGVSTAKGLCYALNIPLIAVDSLIALAHFASSQMKTSDALLLSMIDARRMEAYTALYDSNMYALKPVSADIFDAEYLSELDANQKIMIVGDAQQKCKALWEDRKNLHFTDLEADARGQVEPAYKKYLNQQFADLVYFEPQYFKDFQPGVKAK